MTRYIGIDFSGGIAPWSVRTSRPTVWIAVLEDIGRRESLVSLAPVQDLRGNERPFQKLVNFLAAGDFEVAAIDAPFSLPSAFLPHGGHTELLEQIRLLPNGVGRDFPEGRTLVALGERRSALKEAKPLRETERYWAGRGISVRSTMWAGPRGGAPFTAACLRLLEMAGRPVWPWSDDNKGGMLAEAFPAAQLLQWDLPYQGYSKSEQRGVRALLARRLKGRLDISEDCERLLISSPDALDAVVAGFAAISIARSTALHTAMCGDEGLIAVAR